MAISWVESLLVDGDSGRELLHGVAQTVALLDQALRRARGDALDRLLDHGESGADVPGEPRALDRSHRIERLHGAIDDLHQLVGVAGGIVRRSSDHVRQTQHRGGVDGAVERETFLQSTDLIDVLSEARLVDGSFRLVPSETRRDRDVAARDTTAQRFAHFRLPAAQFGRKLDRGIEEPVIDRANLDGDARSAHLAVRGSETRHALYHIAGPKLRTDKKICQSTKDQRTP